MTLLAARAPPPVSAAPHWWRYVDRARAHEVSVEWREADGALAIVESSPGAPDARVEQVARVLQPWETRVALWLLEGRLAQLGEYWRARSDAAGWTRVGSPVGAPMPDPRPNAVIPRAVAPFVHHFHDENGAVDEVLAGVPAARADRVAVLRARIDVGALEVERIELLHGALPPALARSLLLRERIALTQLGHGELVTRDHYRRAFGERGEERAGHLLREVVERVRGETADPLARAAPDELFAQFLARLDDPRLLALHRRFLHADEEDDLLSAGPVEIRKAVHAKRAQAGHDQKHLLTILEASLLARERIRSGRLSPRDPEVRALTRLAYYL